MTARNYHRLLTAVTAATVSMRGTADHQLRFDNPGSPVSPISVLVYRLDSGLTVFATVGMCAARMPALSYTSNGRAELEFSRRGPLESAHGASHR